MPRPTTVKDVNNLLIESMQLLAEARADKSTPEVIEKHLSDALQRLGQAFAITRSEFTRHDRLEERARYRLDRVFLRNEKFFSMATGNPDLDLICLDDGSVPWVSASPGQLEHLLLSAMVACRELAGGIRPMSVTVDKICISGSRDESITPLRAGEYATIVIQCRARVLEHRPHPTPYDETFDSAEEAENVACGLGTVQRIAASLGGALLFDRSDPRCPVLVTYLPICDSPESVGSDSDIEERQFHDETVLLVDDDPMVRRYTRRALEVAGFHVLEAGDSREAIATIRSEEGHIDVLIADLVLPDMHGGKLARAIQKEFGSVPVIFVSGYDNRAIQHHGLIDQGASLLRKPYTRRSLLTMVEEALSLGQQE